MEKSRIEQLAQWGGTIKGCIQDSAGNLVMLGYALKKIRDDELYKEAGWGSLAEYAKDEFDISKSAISRCIAIDDKFGNGQGWLLPKYLEYGNSKLQEMLMLTDEQLETVTPSMTRNEIRAKKQTPKRKKPEVIEAEVIEPEPVVMQQEPEQVRYTNCVKWKSSDCTGCYYDTENICPYDRTGMPPKVNEEDVAQPKTKYEEYLAGLDSKRKRFTELIDEDVAPAQPDTDDPEYYTVADVEAQIAYHENNMRIMRETDMRNKGRAKTAFAIDALKLLLYKLQNAQPTEVYVQPEFPNLANAKARREWIDAHEGWELWEESARTETRMWRYQMTDTVWIVVEERCRRRYVCGKGYRNKGWEISEYYLVGAEPNYKAKNGAFSEAKAEVALKYGFHEWRVPASTVVDFLTAWKKGDVK